ncbi:DUF7507 domain-containing protein [Lysobacter sp. A421]
MADPNSNGEHVSEICWLQLDGVTLGANGSTPLTFDLPDGSTMQVTVVVANLSGNGLAAVQAPSWTGSQFSGNTDFYTIYTPNRAVLQGNGNNNTSVTLQDIRLFNPVGVEETNAFELILADGESTNTGESLDFGVVAGGTPLQLLEWLGASPSNHLTINTVPTGCGGVGAVDCKRLIGKGGTANAAVFSTTRTGTPFSVVGQLHAVSGNQGFAFGVRWGGVKVRKLLPEGRMEPQDQFDYSVANVNMVRMDGNVTSGAATEYPYVTGQAVMPGNTITLQEVMVAGSPSRLEQYDSTISCTNSGASSTALPSGPYNPASPPTIDLANKGDNVACDIINIPRVVDLKVVKTAPAMVGAGEEFDYTLTISNNGTHTATGAKFTDNLPAGMTIDAADLTCGSALNGAVCGVLGTAVAGSVVTGSIQSLPAGSSVVITIRAIAPTVAGDIENSAVVEVDSVLDTTVGEPTDRRGDNSDSVITEVALADFTLAKAASVADTNGNTVTGDEGDVITYTFAVTNTGTMDLTDVVVSDVNLPGLVCTIASLPVGATDIACAPSNNTHTITAADVTAGQVTNTATATGVPPGTPGAIPPPTPSSPPVDTPTAGPPVADFTLAKSASVADTNGNTVTGDEGDVITYTFAVTNTGTVDLTDVVISDAMLPGLVCTIPALAVGDTQSCTPSNNTHTITAADVTAGQVTNTATATGVPPGTPGAIPPPTPSSPPVDTPTAGPPVADFTLAKSASVADTNGNTVTGDEGDVITYTFAVTNTGTVDLTDVVVSDVNLPGLVCTIASLPVGATEIACAPSNNTYTITAADVTATKVTNTATATGVPPGTPGAIPPPTPSSPPVDTPTGGAPVADFTLGKAASVADTNGNTVIGDEGDVITYTFTATNTGTVDLTDVVVSDVMLPTLVCAIPTLAVGDTQSCAPSNNTYTITAADVAAGEVVNTATGTGVPPGAPGAIPPPTPSSPPVDTPTAGPPVADFTLAKSASVADTNGNTVTGDEGDVITYTFTATNTGTVDLTDVVVSDVNLPGLVCTIASLPVGATDIACAPSNNTYTITAADVTAGTVTNTAAATGVPPGTPGAIPPPTPSSPPVDTPTVGPPVADFTLAKSASVADTNGNTVTGDEGDVITYTFTATNTGTVDLTDVVVSDVNLPGLVCTIASLPVGATEIACAPSNNTYTITAADVTATKVTNTATATGVPPGTPGAIPPPTPSSPPVDTPTGGAPVADFTLGKSASVADTNGNTVAGDEGDVITYTFAVTNTGTVDLTDVVVSDPMLPGLVCTIPTLAVGDTDIACAPSNNTYTITAADVTAGTVTNTATATGVPPGTPGAIPPPTPSSPPVDTPTEATPVSSLTLVKSAGTPSGNAVGDSIEYSFLVTNTGNTRLTDLVVIDDKLDVEPICLATILEPAESTTCTGVYVLTQADVNAGQVMNSATAEATPPTTPSNPTPPPVDSPPSTTNTPIASTPSMTVVKSAAAPSGNAVGDTIDYSFLVTNTGNVTIDALVINDDQLTTPAVCPVTTLAPGDTTTCTGTYVLTQADVNAGQVVNTATAAGTPPVTPGNPTPPPVDSPPSTTNTPIASTPSMTVVKSAAAPSGNAVGDTIDYSFLVTNTGNVTIDALVINDDQLTTPAVCPVTTLVPGDTTTCTGTYVLTQADVNAGQVVNSATAEATPPTTPSNPTPPPVDSPPSTTNTPIASTPSMTVVKSAAAPSGNAVGDTIDYSFLVTNTGNVTIDALVINDDQLTTPAVCPVTTLAPGAETTCTGSYVLTQADVNAGEVVNTATATGTPPVTPGNPAPPPVDSPPSTTNTPIDADPTITSNKVMSGNADEDGSGTVTVGDTITYAVTATNTGNVTLTDVTVADSKIVPATITCGTLEPGAACVLTGAYVVTVEDALAGVVVNTAVITDGKACPVGSTAEACQPTIEVPVVVPEISADDNSDITPQNTPVTTSVLVNDSLNGSPIENPQDVSVTVIAQPEHGEVVVNPDGTITYTPVPGYSGTDTYQYEICEAANPSNCAIATVTITILPNVVEAIDDAETTKSGTPVKIMVPGNDTSIGAPLDPGSVTQVSPPSHGSITINPDGSISYVPTPGFAGEDSFVYRICDASTPTPVCDEATVTITVTGEASLRLSKAASVREVKIGDLVRYTLNVENTGVVDVANAMVLDTAPAGFSYVEGSLTVADGDNAGTVVGQSPLRFEGLDIAIGQRATLVYLMRVGAGVRPGSHINQAQAYSGDGEQPLSNIATAEVALTADAVLDDSLLLGTVFDDRDGDGWQDGAALTKLHVQGGFSPAAYIAGSTTVDRGQGPVAEPDASSPMLHGIRVGEISGRGSLADPVDSHRVVISQRLDKLSFTNDFVMTSAQGVTVRMDAGGKTTVEQRGDAAKGLTAAAPVVERRVAQVDAGYAVDYVITNTGIDERGVPGVRIASVEGLLIETDQFGRYHLAGIAGGDWARGRNFILKVDPSTLPPGAEFTTDNPLVRRITPGLPVRFDFGVKLPVEEIPGGEEQVEMMLEEMLFSPGSAQLRDIYLPAIGELATKLVQYDGGEVVIDANGGEALAFERASTVKAALMQLLPEQVAGKTSISVRADVDDASTRLVGFDGDDTLLGTVLFDTDKSTIRPEFNALIAQVAAELERREGGTVVLVGHTDVRASAEYNAALGLRRSRAVYEAIAERLSPQVRATLRVESSNDSAAPAAGKN